MAEPDTLFAVTARYSIDTNVILSFLGDSDAEHYPADAFKPQWDFVERAMKNGRIVAARRVETELEKWEQRLPQLKVWLDGHKVPVLRHERCSTGWREADRQRVPGIRGQRELPR